MGHIRYTIHPCEGTIAQLEERHDESWRLGVRGPLVFFFIRKENIGYNERKGTSAMRHKSGKQLEWDNDCRSTR